MSPNSLGITLLSVLLSGQLVGQAVLEAPMSLCDLVARRDALMGVKVQVRGAWTAHDEGSWLSPESGECILNGTQVHLSMATAPGAPDRPPLPGRKPGLGYTMALVGTYSGILGPENAGPQEPRKRVIYFSEVKLAFTYTQYSDAKWVDLTSLTKRPLFRREIK